MHKRIIVLVAAALAGILVLAILNVNFLARRNKDFLIDRLRQALGRKISADEIRVTFWPFGIGLVNLAVADDPAFSTDDFLRASDLRLELRFLPLLIGQFRPKRIRLDSPTITIVRDARGRYNFASRPRNGKNRHENADAGKRASTEQHEDWIPLASSIDIANGTLRYRDLTDGDELTATQIELKMRDFDWDEPFDIELDAAVADAKPNLHFKSRIGPIAGNRDYREVPVAGEINAVDLDLGKVNKSVPRLRRALPRALRFDGIYTIKDLRFKGTLNNLALKGAVTGTDASFRFE